MKQTFNFVVVFVTERCGGCARGLHQIPGALSILLRLLEEVRGLREEEGQPRKCPNGESDRILCSLGYLSLYDIIIINVKSNENSSS